MGFEDADAAGRPAEFPGVLAFVVFPTALGECAIVWRQGGGEDDAVVGSTLPQGGPDQVRRAVRQWYPGAVESRPTPMAASALEAVTRLLAHGDGVVDVPLDLSRVPVFDRRVYEVVRAIPPGETLTYGEVAARVGAPGAAQAVGQAMGRNPFPPLVPCHRVLAAGRKIGGFSARGGALTKLRMLEREGVYLEQPTLFDL
ncbi:MGMT family protein [Myceligenerans crystallogenes]|uniref:Methylated-DNA--[protein]-cysteine S-methyltransferase n=1 Tax=Myceligenerans crystallogenes TaxID=316335 RepID=A0ABP4ZFE3_9MICO